MKLLAATLLVPLAVIGWQWWADHDLERTLAPVASGIAGRAVTTDCQSFWANLIDVQWREGEVRFDADGIPEAKLFLARTTCQRLKSFMGRKQHPELDCLRMVDWAAPDPLPFESPCYAEASETIYALLVLAHEAYHTAGVMDEAAANCYALQAMAWTALQLGAARDEAERMARAMEALEPKQGSTYGPNECHAGLRLDLHPETPEFPTEPTTAAPAGRGGIRGVAAGA
jgi:hypothetical protein